MNSHGNIYPTALPLLLPKEVVEELVEWLEGLLKHTVNRAVKRERRKGSSGSADSRGQSPEEESVEEGGPGERLPGVSFVKRNNTDVTTTGRSRWRFWTAQEKMEAEEAEEEATEE